jgi:ubiquinone/menaquinone biosynthesis C-methylase UbiE
MAEARTSDAQEMLDAFFGEFYLRVYGNRQAGDEAREQALAAARLGACPPGGALLDVACGFGRHAVPLAAEGFRVTGVDRSATLLDEARRRAADVAEQDADRLAFVAADYRELPFEDGAFDAAINLYTSIGFLGDEEDTKVLAEVARVLRPGGRLVVETMHRDLMIRIFQERGWRLLGAGRLLLEQRAFDPVTGVVQETQTLVDSDGARESQTFATRVYTATELVSMLHAAGFEKVMAYGDLDGAPFDVGTRLALVARR